MLFVYADGDYVRAELSCPMAINDDHFDGFRAHPADREGRVPDAVTIIGDIHRRFDPERIRLVQIDPRQDGQNGDPLSNAQVDQLRRWNVEVLTLDNRQAQPNTRRVHGLLLADFFDFT